jgi:hydrogenase maturation protein HypF
VNQRIRVAVRVEGIVQGVGFRPFVHGLACRLGLSGHVGNDSGGVFAEVEGERAAVERFLTAVRCEGPPLAAIERVSSREVPAAGANGFVIVASPGGGEASTAVSADSATCTDCLAELADPADRRYRYPFINCTHCGSRFTIVRGVPYDRPKTTMAAFTMCADCAREYHDPRDRCFHAQPVCCPACGPALRLLEPGQDGFPAAGDPISATSSCGRAGSWRSKG